MTLPKHYVSAAGIVLNSEGHVLLIRRRDNRLWEPPGGVVELSEGLDSAVVREVKEESGVDVEVLRLTGIYKNVGKKGYHVVTLTFLCRHLSGVPATGEETVDAVFLPKEEALRRVTRDRMRVRLEDAFTGQKMPFVRNFLHPET